MDFQRFYLTFNIIPFKVAYQMQCKDTYKLMARYFSIGSTASEFVWPLRLSLNKRKYVERCGFVLNVSLCLFRFEIGINRTEDTEQVVIPVCLREKFRHSGYSHHSGSTHFGQPFLIAVPRNNTEDKLYNLLLVRMW